MFCNIKPFKKKINKCLSRNPCFIRLCFAIMNKQEKINELKRVAILVLLDYVLQYDTPEKQRVVENVAILVLLDYVLQ